MFVLRYLSISLATIILFVPALRADRPASLLRLVPANTDFLLNVPHPRQLVETATGLKLLQQLEQFSAYKEILNSTKYRHFQQILAYYEKKLGASWPKLVDEIAGSGLVLGIENNKDTPSALLVIQGRDEKQGRKFVRLVFDLLEQEFARRDEKFQPAKNDYRGVETFDVGDKVFVSVAGSTILVANNKKKLQMSLDLYLGRGGKSCAEVAEVSESIKILPPDALATFWLKLDTARKQPDLSTAFKSAPRDDIARTILFGGYLDLFGRSSFAASALVREGDDLLITIRLPRGRCEMGADAGLHVPPAGSVGSRPLLEPKRVLFSTSFYLDVARIWEDRDKLFTKTTAQSIEKYDKQTNILLAGLRLSKILPQTGSYHRFVAVTPPTTANKQTDRLPVPAFALVSELRDPKKFRAVMDSTLRGIAQLAGFKVKLKLVEEKIGDVTLVGFRFPDDQPAEVKVNDADLRFYFSPCFACVGDQFIWCSTIELGRELVGMLQKEKKGGLDETVKSRFYPAGVTDFFSLIEERLTTKAVLDRALSYEQANTEIKAFLELLQTLGPLCIDVRYDDKRFSYDFRFKGLK